MKKFIGPTILAIFLLLGGFSLSNAGRSALVANLESGRKQTVVAYGTSLTAVGPWVQQLQDALDRRYPNLAQVINSGKSGMWSKWGVENLDTLVIEKNPDAIFLEFAINDAYLACRTSVQQARKNLEDMIGRISKSAPDCETILMTMNPPVGTDLKLRPRIKDYYQMYRDVAQARKLKLVDLYPEWAKILETDPALFKRYVPDGLHPGVEGCRKVVTPLILKTLGIGTFTEKPVGLHRSSSVFPTLPGLTNDASKTVRAWNIEVATGNKAFGF